jgi:hypothetical protein
MSAMDAFQQTIAVRINPRPPVADVATLCQEFPTRLRELAGGQIAEHTAEVLPGSHALLFTFEVADVSLAVEIVVNLVQLEKIMGADFRDCTIAVKRGERFDVVFPAATGASFP